MYYEAIYQPRDEDNIKEQAKRYIGKKIALQEGFQKDTTAKKKNVCYIAVPSFGMIPNYDLKDIKSIPFNDWKIIRKISEEV